MTLTDVRSDGTRLAMLRFNLTDGELVATYTAELDYYISSSFVDVYDKLNFFGTKSTTLVYIKVRLKILILLDGSVYRHFGMS